MQVPVLSMHCMDDKFSGNALTLMAAISLQASLSIYVCELLAIA